ncbi:MAG: nitronate monooxygenase [Dehalococcoidia bacterium]|nr:nitronate monooxygenase [Dehalococcoidia bacterium]
MFKTRMTELFGIKHPIMLAGMNWITTPPLVSAVCNAGGLGILATAHCGPEEVRKLVKEVRELTDKPFGINQILIGPNAKDNIEAAIQEKVPVINYSLGKPWFIDQVHAYGGKVVGTIAIAKHGAKAQQLGCDALVVTGHEAAAHGDVATSLVLIPVVASQVKIPLIAAGGFYDGRGLAAALALGAEGISMGTRFTVTKESMAHDAYKQLVIGASEQDTLYSTAFDGMPGRVLKTKAASRMMKGGFPMIEAFKGAKEVKDYMGLSYGKFIAMSFQMLGQEEGHPLWVLARQAAGTRRHLMAIEKGDVDEGILFAGQNVGGIKDIPGVQEVIDRTIAEAEAVLDKIQKERA